MATTVKFVTAVGESDTAHTRLDLTALDPAPDYRRVQVGDGADWGWPALSTVVAEGVGGDGDVPVASRYGNRTITLPIVYTDQSTPDQRRAALSALARELDRDRNVLYVAADGASEGRWLVTYRAAQAAADLRTWGPSDAGLAVTLTAEPFAYGPLETAIPWALGGPGTDPAPHATSTTLGVMAADLPASEGVGPTTTAPGGQWYRQVDPGGIKGDVDSPLNLIITPTPGGTIGQRSMIVASRRVRWDDTDGLQYHLTSIDGATPNAPNTGDAGSSSGDTARLTSSAALNSWYAVMTGALPSPTDLSSLRSRELRGRWRIFARARCGTAGAAFDLQLGFGNTANFTLTGPAPTPALRGTYKTTQLPARVVSTTYALTDLGILELPPAAGSNLGPMKDPPLTTTAAVCLFARRTAGAGVLDVDFMIAVPADGRFAVIPSLNAAGALPAPYQINIDSDSNVVAFRLITDAGEADDPSVTLISPRGGLPRVYPRHTTQLFVIPEVGDANGITPSLARPVAVAASYWPRYLSVL